MRVPDWLDQWVRHALDSPWWPPIIGGLIILGPAIFFNLLFAWSLRLMVEDEVIYAQQVLAKATAVQQETVNSIQTMAQSLEDSLTRGIYSIAAEAQALRDDLIAVQTPEARTALALKRRVEAIEQKMEHTFNRGESLLP